MMVNGTPFGYSQLLQLLLDSHRHRLQRAIRPPERVLTGVVHEVVLAAAAAAFFRGQSDIRHHHLLAFEACERDVDAADRDFTVSAILDLAADGRAVRAVAEAEQREQHQLLEFSEDGRIVVFNMYHLIKYMR